MDLPRTRWATEPWRWRERHAWWEARRPETWRRRSWHAWRASKRHGRTSKRGWTHCDTTRMRIKMRSVLKNQEPKNGRHTWGHHAHAPSGRHSTTRTRKDLFRSGKDKKKHVSESSSRTRCISSISQKMMRCTHSSCLLVVILYWGWSLNAQAHD